HHLLDGRRVAPTEPGHIRHPARDGGRPDAQPPLVSSRRPTSPPPARRPSRRRPATALTTACPGDAPRPDAGRSACHAANSLRTRRHRYPSRCDTCKDNSRVSAGVRWLVEHDADYRGALRELLGVFDRELAPRIKGDAEEARDDARPAKALLRGAAELLGIGRNHDGA